MKTFIRAFKQFSKKLAAVQTFILLTAVYILIVPFVKILFHIFKPPTKNNSWSPWTQRFDTISDLEKQF